MIPSLCTTASFLAILLVLSLAHASAAFDIYETCIVRRYPHDPFAFTEGLTFSPHSSHSLPAPRPLLLESTGIWGASTLRAVDLLTGHPLSQLLLSHQQFGEGIALSPSSPSSILQLTYQNHTALAYPLASLLLPSATLTTPAVPAATFALPAFIREGWGLASSPSSPFLHLSDGSSTIHSFAPPFNYSHSTPIHLPLSHSASSTSPPPLPPFNELELTPHHLLANLYTTRCILLIPHTSGLLSNTASAVIRVGGEDEGWYVGQHPAVEVMNGVAWDEEGGRLWLTGKMWPWMYEVDVVNVTESWMGKEAEGEDGGGGEERTAEEMLAKACPTTEWTEGDEKYQQNVIRRVQEHVLASEGARAW